MAEEKKTFQVITPDGELKDWELDAPKLKKADDKLNKKNQSLRLAFEWMKKAGMATGKHYRLILIVASCVYLAVWIWQERSFRLEELHRQQVVAKQLLQVEEGKRERIRIRTDEERKRRDEVERQQLERQRLEEQLWVEEEHSRQAKLRQTKDDRRRRDEEERRLIMLRRQEEIRLAREAKQREREEREPHTYKTSQPMVLKAGASQEAYFKFAESVIDVPDDFYIRGIRIWLKLDVKSFYRDEFLKPRYDGLECNLVRSGKVTFLRDCCLDGCLFDEFNSESSKGEWKIKVRAVEGWINSWQITITPAVAEDGTVLKP